MKNTPVVALDLRGLSSVPSLTLILDRHDGDFTDHDLATLSDWASKKIQDVPNPDWKRAYALLREGSDLLLRRRARSREVITQ